MALLRPILYLFYFIFFTKAQLDKRREILRKVFQIHKLTHRLFFFLCFSFLCWYFMIRIKFWTTVFLSIEAWVSFCRTSAPRGWGGSSFNIKWRAREKCCPFKISLRAKLRTQGAQQRAILICSYLFFSSARLCLCSASVISLLLLFSVFSKPHVVSAWPYKNPTPQPKPCNYSAVRWWLCVLE